MLVFTLIVIVLLVALRVIIHKPVKTVKTVKTVKEVKVRNLTRKENASNRGREFQGW